MFDPDPVLFALETAEGLDLFARHQDDDQRRARFACVGRLGPDGALTRYGEAEGIEDEALLDAARCYDRDRAMLGPLSLGQPATWPALDTARDPLRVFLYLDFFRARQVADLAAARFERGLAETPGAALDDIGHLPAAIAPIYQFNMTARALRVAEGVLPALAQRLRQGPVLRERADQAGYGLRMLGDLCLRAGAPAQAQVVFALACDLGDNPFRRQKAIEAAVAAGQTEIAREHARRYSAQWTLPPSLAAVLTSNTGDAA